MNKLYNICSFFFLIFILSSCDKGFKKDLAKVPQSGSWRMKMNLNGKVLPFNFVLNYANTNWSLIVKNGDELIEVEDILARNDSLIINLPIFESSFYLAIKDSSTLAGVWVNYYKSDDYRIPVEAKFNELYRFKPDISQENQLIPQRYKVTFHESDSSSTYPAIGMFSQKGSKVSGTFATETGDYRHLEGNIIGDSLFLSTFDGSHAFLFEAKIIGDSLDGIFLSGTHYKAAWQAKANEVFELRNPDSLTFIKPGYDGLDFSFPDIEGNTVSIKDKQFKNKVLIVQIMGSWCPNCLDETHFLSELYKKHSKEGLEVIALAFERTRTKEKAFANLKALKRRTEANYTILLGGATRNESAEDALPMLNHVMSYPTAIFIDRKGKIRKIHTGFYGPGTRDYYTTFTTETESFVKNLIKETI